MAFNPQISSGHPTYHDVMTWRVCSGSMAPWSNTGPYRYFLLGLNCTLFSHLWYRSHADDTGRYVLGHLFFLLSSSKDLRKATSILYSWFRISFSSACCSKYPHKISP